MGWATGPACASSSRLSGGWRSAFGGATGPLVNVSIWSGVSMGCTVASAIVHLVPVK